MESYDIILQQNKKLSTLLRGITSKNHIDSKYLNCLHSFATESKCECHKKVCENKYFCNVVVPSEDTEILEFNHYQKSYKSPFVIYAGLECLTEETDGC